MSKRNTLLTTAAAAALVGAMTSGAMAFDVVDWNWQGEVNTDFDIFVDVDIDDLDEQDLENLDAGIAKVEAGQVHLGNATSEASLDKVGSSNSLEIENAALSLGNNQSINVSDLALIHSGQFTLGGFDDGIEEPNPDGLQDGLGALALALAFTGGNLFDGGNAYPILGLATLIAAGNGYVVPAEISATATMGTGVDPGVTGNQVSNSATAFANNASWTVGGESIANGTDEGGILIGDLTQLSIANVDATATLLNVTSAGSTPSVSNAATAVGNNLSIKVGIAPPSL